jgi:hypothetical protein
LAPSSAVSEETVSLTECALSFVTTSPSNGIAVESDMVAPLGRIVGGSAKAQA